MARAQRYVAIAVAFFILIAKPATADEVAHDHAAKMARGLELFKSAVAPILKEHCLGCHGGDGVVESEFDLSTRDALLAGGASGEAVALERAEESLLVKLISHAAEPKMPYEAGKLPEAAIRQIAEWIDCGAPYDAPLIEPDEPLVPWTERIVAPEAREHWAFQPLTRAEPPSIARSAWVRTPVDQFVLARLEAAGIEPNDEADKRTLIRRASFDLIGLPPAPAEVRAFLHDDEPGAYERMIDRLLASTHYGERWARHWLDLARFAESHGFEQDYDRPSAYHYRDFVIEALNRDLPYDTFVRWQLAGDELAPDERLAMMATGFLAAGVHSTQITANEVEKHRYDELDDMLATTGTAFLGLTIGCARCHDHKYDAIPQRDYYRMLSTFTATVRSEIDWNLDAEGYRRAKAKFDRRHAPYVKAVEEYEAAELASQQAQWEAAWPQHRRDLRWRTLDLSDSSSNRGTRFKRLGDGSLLADTDKTDAVAGSEIYTLKATTNLPDIRYVRVEALADPSLPAGGPGLVERGAFELSELTMSVASAGARDKSKSVKLIAIESTGSDDSNAAAAATDGKPATTWSGGNTAVRDDAAVFSLDQPAGDEGAVLTFTLRFDGVPRPAIGRLRLAIAAGGDGAPELLGTSVPESLVSVLDKPIDARSADEAKQIAAWYRTIDAGWRRLTRAVNDHLLEAPKANLVKMLVSSEGLKAVRLHTQGEDLLSETHFLRRGDVTQKESVATQSFLQVLMRCDEGEARWRLEPPEGSRTSWNRASLAAWLTDVEHGAGHLLARVIVNRLWQHHLGRGIVATPSDFGTRGEPRSHPELLDWLAGELIRHEWRLKPIHKLIMTSNVYRQLADYDDERAAKDRDNRLLWRRAPTRLEAEVIRDSLLAVSGRLDRAMLGPGTLDPSSTRRSIYFTVKRSQLAPMMQVFDGPDSLSPLAERATTTIAPQALYLMNNPEVRTCAHAFASRVAAGAHDVADDESRRAAAVRRAYVAAFARPPERDELVFATSFIASQAATYAERPADEAEQLALADLCQVLLCMNEFVYVE